MSADEARAVLLDLNETIRQEKIKFGERLLGIMDVFVGVWFFSPFFLVNSPPMLDVLKLMGQDYWGAFFLASAAVRFVSLKHDNDRGRAIAAFWSSAGWSFFAYTFARVGWGGIGTAVFGALATKNLYLYIIRKRVTVGG